VKEADLREAAVIIGLAQVDDLADTLEDWGCGQ
jgi:hypothetical protein